jgi:hypothetical protein
MIPITWTTLHALPYDNLELLRKPPNATGAVYFPQVFDQPEWKRILYFS